MSASVSYLRIRFAASLKFWYLVIFSCSGGSCSLIRFVTLVRRSSFVKDFISPIILFAFCVSVPFGSLICNISLVVAIVVSSVRF